MILQYSNKTYSFFDNTKNSRKKLKEILFIIKNIDSLENLNFDFEILYTAILSNTRVGNYFLKRKYFQDNILQKDLKKIKHPEIKDNSLYFKLYKISLLLLNSDLKEKNIIMFNSIFKIIDALYMEDLGLLKESNLFFRKHLDDYLNNLNIEDIDLEFSLLFLEKIENPDNVIRNNIKLIFVRNKDLKEIYNYPISLIDRKKINNNKLENLKKNKKKEKDFVFEIQGI